MISNLIYILLFYLDLFFTFILIFIWLIFICSFPKIIWYINTNNVRGCLNNLYNMYTNEQYTHDDFSVCCGIKMFISELNMWKL